MNQYDWISSIAAGTGVNTTTVGATMGCSPYITRTSGTATIQNGTGVNCVDTITTDLFNNAFDYKGDANFTGDVKIKGVSLSDTLARLEERLAILRPNEALEDRWEQLRDLGKQYRKLEKEVLEKEQVWKILKK